MSEQELFDVERFRRLEDRTLCVRSVQRGSLVLGSTQPLDIVDPDAIARAGVDLFHRRSGGGAVMLVPGHFLWVDTWIPRADPLSDADIGHSRLWLGRWWADSLGGHGAVIHHGQPVGSPWSDLICFAGLASGEVSVRGRKVVGMAQWRCRQGSLTHSLAYVDIDWKAMVGLLTLGSKAPMAARDLAESTLTVAALGFDEGALLGSLLDHLPDPASWSIEFPS